jgi:uncharacterized membrane protein
MKSRTTVINNTTVVAAPPVFSPFGFSPFGGFGFSFMPVVPIPFFGGFFQLFVLFALVSVVFSVVRGLTAGSQQQDKKKDDGWGDL